MDLEYPLGLNNMTWGGSSIYIISYDISDDKKRNKIAKELKNYGKRVQYSVFELHITEKQYEALYKKLVCLMADVEVGDIRIYKMCMRCEQQIQVIGIDDQETDFWEEDIFIV